METQDFTPNDFTAEPECTCTEVHPGFFAGIDDCPVHYFKRETTETDAEPKQEAAPFMIDSDSRADWYLEKLLTIQARRDVLNAQVERMRRELNNEEAGLKARFGPQFEAYAREKIENKRGKGKSHDFFFGRVSVRTVPESFRVTLSGSLDDLPDDARTMVEAVGAFKTVVDAAAFREIAKTEYNKGILLPGVETVPARESFSVKFSTTASEAVEAVEGDAE